LESDIEILEKLFKKVQKIYNVDKVTLLKKLMQGKDGKFN
jgi:hypothetical protein